MCPPGVIHLDLFNLNKAKIDQNAVFFCLFAKGFPLDSLALDSLELLSKLSKKLALGTHWVYDKKPHGPNVSRTYPVVFWTEYHDLKAIWSPPGPRWLIAWLSSPLGAPGCNKRNNGARIFFDIRHMSMNTGLILAFVIYTSHMVTFNTRSLFIPTLDIICW